MNSFGVTHCVANADGTAPVLHHERDVMQVERFDQGSQIRDMGRQGVFVIRRSLAFAETHVVRNDHPMRCRDRRDEAAVDVAPGGLAMQHHHRTAAALVDIMLAEPGGRTKFRCIGPGAIKRLIRLDHGSPRSAPLHRILKRR